MKRCYLVILLLRLAPAKLEIFAAASSKIGWAGNIVIAIVTGNKKRFSSELNQFAHEEMIMIVANDHYHFFVLLAWECQ